MPVGVALITWTCDTVWPFTVAGATRTSLGGEPAIDQPEALWAAAPDPFPPAPVGRVSVTATLVAGSAPRLNSVTLKPICAPGETRGASEVLRSESDAPAGAEQLGNLKLPMRVRQFAALFGAL